MERFLDALTLSPVKVLNKILLLSSLVFAFGCTMNATMESLNVPSDESKQLPIDSKAYAKITSSLQDLNSLNANNYTISGTCGYSSSVDVKINGVSIGRAICSAGDSADQGTWSSVINLASISDGNISISIDDVASAKSLDSKSFVKDVTGPVLSSFSDGVYRVSTTESPAVTWNAASDALSGVSHYQIALGSSNISQDIVNWTSIGNVLNYQFSSLSLTVNQDYYIHLRAVDTAGNIGAAVVSDGWKALAPLSLANKTLITGESVNFSASGGGSSYSYSGSSYINVAGLYAAPLGVAPYAENVTVTDHYGLTQTAQAKVRAFQTKDLYNYNTTVIASDSQPFSMVQDSLGNMFVVGTAYDASSTPTFYVRKSIDSGATWSNSDIYLAPNSIGTVAKQIICDSSDNLYVVGYSSTGSSMGSILVRKSRDRGVTWTTILDYSSGLEGTIQGISISKSSSGDLYVAGALPSASGKGLWAILKSTNEGASWTVLTPYTYPGSETGTAHYVKAISSTEIYAVGTYTDASNVNRWIVQKSTDAGASWSLLDDYNLVSGKMSLAFGFVKNTLGDMYVSGYAQDSSYVLRWILRKSSDGGVTWSTVDDYVYASGKPSMAAALDVDSNNNVYVAGVGFNSTYILHWVVRKYSSGGVASTIMDYNAASGVSASGSGVYVAPGGAIYSVGIGATTIVYPGNANHWYVRKTTDGGSSWSNIDDTYLAKGATASVKGIIESSGKLLSVGSANETTGTRWLARSSSDNGETWVNTDDYSYAANKASTANAVGKDTAGNLYTVGSVTDASSIKHWFIRKSSNNGSSWSTVSDFNYAASKSSEAFAIANDGATLYVAGSGIDSSNNTHWLVRKSTDAGATWSTVSDYYLANTKTSIAMGIAVVGSSIYVVGSGVDSSNYTHWIVRKSTDSGATWATVDDFNYTATKESIARSVVADSNGNIFVAGYSIVSGTSTKWTVRKSSDAGATWTTVDAFSEGASASAVAYAITADSGGNIYTTGYVTDADSKIRFSVRKSSDGGATWSLVEKHTISSNVSSYGYALIPCLSNKICVAGQGSINNFVAAGFLVKILSDL